MKKLLFTILLFASVLTYGQNLLLNGTFTNADEWTLINGSTATGGTLTVVANGNVAADFPNWSAQYANILPDVIWGVRRYRLTFDARQTVGSGGMQIAQRFSVITTQALTGSFVTYQIEFNGAGGSAGNDLVFGGATVGDTFEIQNMVLEDIGISTVNGEAGLPAPITFFTDFETGTYTYSDQWGANGVPESEINQWEVDTGLPRTTDHIDAHISTGRDGTGRAIWLGSYNSPTGSEYDRNELGKDNALSWYEHWFGVSFYVANQMRASRIVIQERNLTDGGSNSVNPISIRENSNGTQLSISLSQTLEFVDATNTYLAANTPLNPDTGTPVSSWYGAGTGATTYNVDYTPGTWVDLVVHFKGAFGAGYTGDTSTLDRQLGYDLKSDGYVEIWINGVKVIDHVGTTVYAKERDGANTIGLISPKIGPYWSSALTPIPGGTSYDIYYDNFKIWNGPGGTYADVDPNPSSVGYTVTPVSGLTTTESGGTDTFTVVLNELPASSVVFDITSNDTGEGTVSSSQLTFTTVNWATPQTITVTGVDDGVTDGNAAYTVTVSVNDAGSDDNYDPLVDTTVNLNNTDNDTGSGQVVRARGGRVNGKSMRIITN